jgi:thioredoxin-related protein
MPELITIYQQYKNKGFEIVGISLDESKENWNRATENLKITWPQFSNLKGWEEDCARIYGVNGIPHTILIDRDGKIIEHELDGFALKFKLEELLGSK